jgi:very-short-patch-repair endonuclease/catechol 2,3-dioxygenase-like lactoylglutathione lyase family enzyme
VVLRAIDHVQIAIPVGGENLARPFYGDLLGLTEVPKPAELAKRGGCWFEGAVKVHLGVEQDFRANVKAHVAFEVDDRLALAQKAKAAGWRVTTERDQLYIYDPFGNRLEFVDPATPLPSPWRGEGSGKRRRETVVPGGVDRARRLRRDMTFAERKLWEQLRRLNLNFRRQAPIGRYIVDFAYHASKLVVEIDGPVHDTLEAKAYDDQRTGFLISAGYRVIRFSDRDVADRLHDIVERIVAEATPPPSPTLPPSRGKGEERYSRR